VPVGSANNPRREGGFEVDLKYNCLYFDGRLIDLELKDFKVFRALFEVSPSYLTVSEILATAWAERNTKTYVDPNNVHQSIKRLRDVLDRCSGQKILAIRTKRNCGYRLDWNGPVAAREQYIVERQPTKEHSKPTGALARVEIADTTVIALDIHKSTLWTYELPSAVRVTDAYGQEWRSQRVDIHGKGDRGVLITVRFIDHRIPDSIYYFSSNGDLEWKVDADPDLLDRGGQAFPRAWGFRHTITSSSVGATVVWAALANEAGWGGCVLRIDYQGKATVQLANAGFVEWLCPTVAEHDDCLIVCGENNAFDQSFIALIGMKDPPCSSPPGGRLRYRYANAPTGTARKYILFPKTELIEALDRPYGHANRMDQSADNVIAIVEAGERGSHFRYHFSPTLESKYVFPSSNYEFQHQELERVGKIKHSWIECPEFAHPLLLTTWTPQGGWEQEIIRWRDNPWKET
jgi:DNA-binding winged helix-turn-helix (wHTH) protein